MVNNPNTLLARYMLCCSKCQKTTSVYNRVYSGEHLCKKCFVRSIEDKAARTISKYSMIGYGDKVAVAIDEGINGYRDEALQIVKEFCNRLRVESEVISYKSLFGIDMDEAMIRRPSEKMSSCSICGTFRRRAIDIAAETVGADIVATAHNLDDQLQTFMINLLAGDVERIGWTYPEPVQYTNSGMKKVKPFIEIYEYEIAFYALQREIPFQSEECPYMNESIRTDIREFFNRLERDRPGIKYNAYNSMTKVSKILRGVPSSSQSKKCSVCG